MSNLDLWWEQIHSSQSLPLILAQRADPAAVGQMIGRGWLVDFNEVSALGIPLVGHLYSRTPRPDDYSDCDGVSLDAALSPSPEVSDLLPRFDGDFGPIVAFMISQGANPWLSWEFTSADKTLPSELTAYTPASGHSSLLHCAVAKSDVALVKALLSHPSRPSIEQLSTYCFTLEAAQVRNANNYGRYVDPAGEAYANSGRSALPLFHLAANLNYPDSPAVVRAMVQAGFNPNAKDVLGRAPVFYARSKEMVSTLLDLGADPSVSDNKGNSLSKYWAHHQVSQKNFSELYGLVISHGAKEVSDGQLREIHEADLLKGLSSGKKVSVVNIFKKAKFTFDQTFASSNGSIKWDLVVPVLLRHDVEKALPILDWLFKKVDIKKDLGEGFTSMGLALATPGVPVSTSLQSIKEPLTAKEASQAIIRSVSLTLENGWGSANHHNKLLASYISWALVSQLTQDCTYAKSDMKNVQSYLLSRIPFNRSTDKLTESSELSETLLQSQNLNSIFIGCIKSSILKGNKIEYIDTSNTHYSMMALCFDKWLSGDKSYASATAASVMMSLASNSPPSRLERIWIPGSPDKQAAPLELRTNISDHLPEIFLDVPSEDLEVLSSYVSQIQNSKITPIQPMIRVVQLGNISRQVREHKDGAQASHKPKM